MQTRVVEPRFTEVEPERMYLPWSITLLSLHGKASTWVLERRSFRKSNLRLRRCSVVFILFKVSLRESVTSLVSQEGVREELLLLPLERS